MSAETTAAQAPGAPVVCSRAGCRAEARWQERNLNAAETREGIAYDPAKLYGGKP